MSWGRQDTSGILQHAFCTVLCWKKHLGEFELEESEFTDELIR